jgi:hypothetical protein
MALIACRHCGRPGVAQDAHTCPYCLEPMPAGWWWGRLTGWIGGGALVVGLTVGGALVVGLVLWLFVLTFVKVALFG